MGTKLIVAITLTPEALEALDKMRGKESRGAFLEELLREVGRHG